MQANSYRNIVTERHEGLTRQKLETSSADGVLCAPPGSAHGHRNRTDRGRLNVPLSLSITSDLESIEDEWRCFEERADCTPFQTFDWLCAWQSCIGNQAGVKPAILTGRQGNEEPLFILPLAIERTRFSRRCVFLGHGLCDYNGPLLAPEFSSFVVPADFVNWWNAIEAFIRKTGGYEYDILLLDKMPTVIGRQLNPMLAIATTINADRGYRACLGSEWEGFYSAKRSSKTRRRDRTKRNGLTKIDELRVVMPTDPEDRQSVLGLIFEQKSKSFARQGVCSLFDLPGHTDFYRFVAAKADRLIHISRLDVGSTCVAATLGLRFRGCYYYILASYTDGPLKRFGPGVILLHDLIRYAISQRYSHFDFTIGDHPYKREWADEELKLYDHIDAASWFGLPVAALTTLTPRAKRLLKRLPLLRQLVVSCRSVVRFLSSTTHWRSPA
jgi:CelD/BcsL family acetyltransferase involved in cellulose biosynthesis